MAQAGGSGATSADFDRFNAELTDSLKAEITQDLLGEGDWEWHELFDFLSDIKMEKLKAQMHSIRCGSEHELADSRAFINNPRRVLDRCEWALAPYQEVNARWHRQHPEPEILSEDGIPL